MMYKYICFDLDGTLTQSEFGIIKAARFALKQVGIDEPDDRKLLRFIGPPLYVSFSDYYGLDLADTEIAIEHFRSIYDTEGYKDAPMYDGMEDVLQKLKGAGRHLIMVTSKPHNMAVKVSAHTGLDKYMETIIGPDGEMKDASKADLLRKAINYAECNDLSEMIMIGDRRYDIEGACETGIDSIGALYGYGTLEELQKAGATYIAEAPADILKFIL